MVEGWYATRLSVVSTVDKNSNEWHEMHMNMCWMAEKVVIIDDNLRLSTYYTLYTTQ